MIIIDGKKCSTERREEIKELTQIFKDECGFTPTLGIIHVGDDPASESYVKGKKQALLDVGMEYVLARCDSSITEEELINQIESFNNEPSITGILVQLPLPKHIDADNVLSHIIPEKDVDGLTASNIGNMMIDPTISEDYNYFIPCTPKGILYLLETYKIKTENKTIVIIGRSNIVGRPIANLLSKNAEYANANIILLHSKTEDLSYYTMLADIIILAAGKPNLLTPDMVKQDAVIIDVGVNRIPSTETKSGFKLVGDCNYKEFENKVSYITPVPGGCGPMTITMLLDNLIQASYIKSRKTDKIYNQLKY